MYLHNSKRHQTRVGKFLPTVV